MRTSFGILLFVAIAGPMAFAEGKILAVNPNQSVVAFSLADVLHSVHGTFHVESGTVKVDRSSQAKPH